MTITCLKKEARITLITILVIIIILALARIIFINSVKLIIMILIWVATNHCEGVQGAPCNIVLGTKTTPNQYGVYQAQVNNKTGNGGISSFFLTSMTPNQITQEMRMAYANRTFVSGNE